MPRSGWRRAIVETVHRDDVDDASEIRDESESASATRASAKAGRAATVAAAAAVRYTVRYVDRDCEVEAGVPLMRMQPLHSAEEKELHAAMNAMCQRRDAAAGGPARPGRC